MLLLVPFAWLCLSGRTSAQATDLARLSADLCGCVDAIDPRATDATVEGSVSTCLENAVIEHPYAVRELLHAGPSSGTPGYRIGQMLGALLDKECVTFRALRVRLQEMHREIASKKGST